MMVETMLESQDFGMSGMALPQWKRELLQRRASRPRPPVLPPSAPRTSLPAPAQPPTEEEELRYGPGIVKRLQSRYLSLALRESRRRPDLRRAASLDHLAASTPPPNGEQPPEPCDAIPQCASPEPPLADPPRPLPPKPVVARRDYVKRARSVDALSRVEPASPPPPPPCASSRPLLPRGARPPRRPQPPVRDSERPPPDLVRSALRKFEPTATRRTPAARVAAVVRGLEGDAPASGPEGVKRVSRAALDGIARAGHSVSYCFGAREGRDAVPLSATNPVLAARARLDRPERRVGVIRPLPPAPPPREPSPPLKLKEVIPPPRIVTPPPIPTSPLPDKIMPISTIMDYIPRNSCKSPDREIRVSTSPEKFPANNDYDTCNDIFKRDGSVAEIVAIAPKHEIEKIEKKMSNGWREESPMSNGWREETPERGDVVDRKPELVNGGGVVRGVEGAARKPRGVTAGGATSVVFNFSQRKEVPDYIENDGVIRRAPRSQRLKAGDPGVVVLDAGRATRRDSSSSSEGGAGSRSPSPCAVRFINDNVVINGRGCMQRTDPARQAKLKLQFDESLTQTHEYPSETSLCEEEVSPRPPSPASPSPSPPPPGYEARLHTLTDNSHLGCVSLSRYTPSKSARAHFELGVTRQVAPAPTTPPATPCEPVELCAMNGGSNGTDSDAGPDEAGDAAARHECSWSEARALRTDLLF